MIYALPILAILLAALLGYVLGHAGRYRMVLLAALAGVVGIGLCIMAGRQHQGWDGIGYTIMALLVLAPAIGGLLLGTLMGWLRRRREARALA